MFKTLLFTTLAMFAFAANSVLCRQALGNDTIDAASFTFIRLISGALILWLIVLTKNKSFKIPSGNLFSAGMLFVYAVTFSFAYISLSTGMGALILFGAVQLTMIFAGLRAGERPRVRAWFGITLAIGGLIFLVWPGLSAPSTLGALLMTSAGIAWGLYSLRGRQSTDPLATTAGNFVYAVPLALIPLILNITNFEVSQKGVLLAVISGAFASGLGYVIWYSALPGLAATHAATVQLSVPVLAAFGGALFLSESITFRLLMASFGILLGICLVLLAQPRKQKENKIRVGVELATKKEEGF